MHANTGASAGRRTPYVVAYGAPDSRLIDVVISPRELVDSRGALRLNTRYYIGKAIVPALQRVLGLAGADVEAWCGGAAAQRNSRFFFTTLRGVALASASCSVLSAAKGVACVVNGVVVLPWCDAPGTIICRRWSG